MKKTHPFTKNVSNKVYDEVCVSRKSIGCFPGKKGHIVVDNCKFKILKLDEVVLSKVVFLNCEFEKLEISDSTLMHCQFSNCKIRCMDTIDSCFLESEIVDCTIETINIACTIMYGGSLIDNKIPSLASPECLKFGLSMYGTTTTKNSKIERSLEAMSSILPSHGDLIGWKKAWRIGAKPNHVIVKLLIPSQAAKSNATGRKCRCSEAKVLSIFEINKDGTLGTEINTAHSDWDVNFKYKKGKTVKPSSPFCPFKNLECESGIHFFITLQEALDYKL